MNAPVEKYDTMISKHLSIYCWLQFVLILFLYEAVMPVLDVCTSSISLISINKGGHKEGRWGVGDCEQHFYRGGSFVISKNFLTF